MAKHDVRYYGSQYKVSTTTPTVTFAGAPSSGDIIVLAYGAANDAVATPPSGFTLLDAWDGSGDSGKISFYAKLAGGSEPSSYSATIANERDCGGVGYVIEGPFSSLAALTFSARQDHANAGSATILSSASSLAQAGIAIAFTGVAYGASYGDIAGWSNSFTAQTRGGGLSAHIDTAYRVYAAADSGVQTVATFATNTWGAAWLLLVSEAGGGGGTKPRRNRVVSLPYNRRRAKHIPASGRFFSGATLVIGAPVLPPDYYDPRTPTVTFPRAVSPTVTFPAAVAPTVILPGLS